MDFMVHFTMGTGGHYITMLPADWSISTSHDHLPSSCHSKRMLWNPSIHSDKLTVHFLSTSFDVKGGLLNDINVGCVYVGRDGVPSKSFLILKASSINTVLGVMLICSYCVSLIGQFVAN